VTPQAPAPAPAPGEPATPRAPHRSFYKEHLLSCYPQPLDNGRFQARVAITSLGGGRTRSQRFLDLEDFASFEAAIARGFQAGMDWVDGQG